MVIRVLKFWVTRYPVPVLVLLAGLSLLAGLALPDLDTDPSPELLAPDHESRLAVDRLRGDFTGANNGIIVMLSVQGTDQDTVFNAHTLERVRALTLAFESIHLISQQDRDALAAEALAAPLPIQKMALGLATAPVNEDTWLEVDELLETLAFADPPLPKLDALVSAWPEKLSPVKKVSSLAATDNILARAGRLEVAPIYERVPQDAAGLDRIKKEVGSNDLFSGLLVSNQGRNTSINIELALDEGAVKERYQVYSQVSALVESKIFGPETHYIAGFPAVTAALGKAMEEDSKTLFAIVTLIVLSCLYINFKGVKGVVLPLSVVMLSLVVTLGVMAAVFIPLNVITISLPVFVLSIGVADGIHMFSEYQDHIDQGLDKESAVCRTLDHLTMPVIMTSMTTGAAFFAISITRIVQVKYCGLFVCLGALVAMVFSLLFIPSLLVCLPQKKRPHPGQRKQGEKKAYERILIRMTRWVVKRPVQTTLFSGLVFVVFLAGALQVRVDNNTVAFFKKKAPIFLSSQALNRSGAGSARINFVIRLDPSADKISQPFKQPVNLRAVNGFIDFLKAQPEVGKVTDLTQLIRRIHFVLNDQDPSQDRLPVDPNQDPESSCLIAQLLLLYENGGGRCPV
ncbi:MAG: MMPL family transporter [Desulfobacter sp.]|nr:MMPL family transporter [Desulfobacter sp.]